MSEWEAWQWFLWAYICLTLVVNAFLMSYWINERNSIAMLLVHLTIAMMTVNLAVNLQVRQIMCWPLDKPQNLC